MSIFASQFGYSNPYDPVGLDTGVPKVGVTLPKKPAQPKPEEDPASVGSTTSSTSNAAESAQAALSATAGAEAGASKSAAQVSQRAANAQASAAQMAIERLTHANSADIKSSATANPPASSFVNMPAKSGADATLPSTEWGMHPSNANADPMIHAAPAPQHANPLGGYHLSAPQPPANNDALGGFGHWFAHTFDSARHGVAASGNAMLKTFQQQNSFGEPAFEPKGAPGSPNTSDSNVFAQHGATSYLNPSGRSTSYAPGVSSSGGDLGIGQDGGYSSWINQPEQSAVNDAGDSIANDFTHLNWGQFAGSVARDVGDEG